MTAPVYTSDIGRRLDRLAWSPLHTTILVALGAGWLFDSLEVQIFSNVIGPLGDYFHASVAARDAVLAVWLVGILIGALLGGRLTDLFGRRRLFVITLVWYAAFTVLTGLAPNRGAVYVLRFLAALGVGAEYAIVNATIAEMMPARVRGRVNALVINFWPAGALAASLIAFFVLDTLALSAAVSWRALFILGGVVALVVLYFRRRIPESPRWLLSRGRVHEAVQIVEALETRGYQAGGQTPTSGFDGPTPGLAAAMAELLRRYRGQLALGALLDLAEAFGYYGIFALLSVVVLTQVHISDRQIPLFYIVGNVGGLVGGLIMTSQIERLGRRVTVVLFYSLAAAGVALLAAASSTGSALWVTLAFVVSSAAATAAWTSAYPTFTELFPTHLRGVGVGASVAVGRIGAIVGTLLLPELATRLGATASYSLVIAFWLVGVLAMAVYWLRGGVEARGRTLETLVASPEIASP